MFLPNFSEILQKQSKVMKKRLQTDGATMAALVASAQVFAKDEKGREVVWIKRETECTKRKEIGHYINSRYWMKGIIERNKYLSGYW